MGKNKAKKNRIKRNTKKNLLMPESNPNQFPETVPSNDHGKFVENTGRCL